MYISPGLQQDPDQDDLLLIIEVSIALSHLLSAYLSNSEY